MNFRKRPRRQIDIDDAQTILHQEMNWPRTHVAHESMPLMARDGLAKHHHHHNDRDAPSDPLRAAGRWHLRLVISFLIVLAFLMVLTTGIVTSDTHLLRWSTSTEVEPEDHGIISSDTVAAMRRECDSSNSCFEKAGITVREDRLGLPSFWKYANRGRIDVTYDKRSLLLNGDRTLFLAGSMHPVRLTPATWAAGLDEAVRHGLNMITIYVFWAAHQPLPGMDFDWSLPGGQWDLASAIREAGSRGLFVHARIGPYVCAEYNYGGIPEWVPLNQPRMSMRRPNQLWMDAMEVFVNATISYLTDAKLWAHQGGNIIIGQIENELGDEEMVAADYPITVENNISSTRKANMQDYADWCGEIASRAAPDVIWTMCNGLTARNAINTCNGYGGTGCASSWLETNGQSGRIQVDQPALWTENEAGFQIWGETPTDPSDYFWGRTARDMARDGLKWFARGGTHLNYYMWLGGYNRGRSAAAGIMNIYASDTVMCPSGQRRHPKFGHLRDLHESIASVASILLKCSSALNHSRPLPHLDPDGTWIEGPNQRMFVYSAGPNTELLFVENDEDEKAVVNIQFASGTSVRRFEMEPLSAAMFLNGMLQFDSSSVNPQSMSYKRHTKDHVMKTLGWTSWAEPIGAADDDSFTFVDVKPIEQTDLTVWSQIGTDYAWYETIFSLEKDLYDADVLVETQKASAVTVFIDGVYSGSGEDHMHAEGNVTLSTGVGSLTAGSHTLSILSESLGYFNLVGRWGASTKAKTKGVTGDVLLKGGLVGESSVSYVENLVDGRNWRSRPGLHYEPEIAVPLHASRHAQTSDGQDQSFCRWFSVLFDTPRFDTADASLFLDITIGRGHIWLNGYNLGRFWNITRSGTDVLSQRYYFLPPDLLSKDGHLNQLILFNVDDGDLSNTNLALSWTEVSIDPEMKDEVDFASACL